MMDLSTLRHGLVERLRAIAYAELQRKIAARVLTSAGQSGRGLTFRYHEASSDSQFATVMADGTIEYESPMAPEFARQHQPRTLGGLNWAMMGAVVDAAIEAGYGL